MSHMTVDVPDFVAALATDQDGLSALQDAMTEAAIAYYREHHPEQLADVVSRVVIGIDRPVLAAGGFRGA